MVAVTGHLPNPDGPTVASPECGPGSPAKPIMFRLADAARLTGLSEDFLRRSDCPKVELRGTGARDSRRVVGILCEDLMAWLRRHRQADSGEPRRGGC